MITAFDPNSWQEWLAEQARALGLTVTSGYRTPGQEGALGGPASSFHSRGSAAAPGAVDIGGPAAKLQQLFATIQQAFSGRINELFLNIPGGQSEAVKNNAPLSSNPEAGRAQHLHVALGGTAGPLGGASAPAAAIPLFNQGDAALRASGGTSTADPSLCASQYCFPSVLGAHCGCWSDVWVYGAAVGLVVGGAWMVLQGKWRG